MKLALIFRKVAHWTTGFAFERALQYLGVYFDWLDNNDIWQGRASLVDYDAALCVDDGFALKPRVLPHMPKRSAYYAIDLHATAPADYVPYLDQFGKVYCAQYSFGFGTIQSLVPDMPVEFLPLAWDNLGIPYFPDAERRVPISMIASWSTEQRILWREIIKYKYYGIAEELFREDMGFAYSRSQLGLNVLGGSGHNTYHNHINQRVWEQMGCGCLVLHQDPQDPISGQRIPDYEVAGFVGAQAWFRNADATHHFWDRKPLNGDENLVFWKDASQLLYTIDYYLAPENAEERTSIAERGRKWVTENHTYVHRVRKILGDLGVECP